MSERRASWRPWLFALLGAALLLPLAHQIDPGELERALLAFGLAGIGLILAVYFVEFLADTAGWQLTFVTRRPGLRWLAQLFRVRLVGEREE